MFSLRKYFTIVIFSIVLSLISANSYAKDTRVWEQKSEKSSYLNKKEIVYVTLYGSPDNDPPGGDIAHPVIHQQAGGTGTYADPITFAVGSGYLPVGQIIYYPTLKKYFIMEDDCAGCSNNHVDLWAGYGTVPGILRCEDALTTRHAQIIISPDPTYPVDTTPIWNEATQQCQKPYRQGK